jgi:sulfate/thiosulfate transport system ATP-binding protein
MTISTRRISKKFGRYPALNDVSLDIRDGELLALLGPSGSGKTTLLRVIAGLDFPDEGQVCFGDQDVTYTSAAARRCGFVFQQYALFKHMNLSKNISFGLDVRKAANRPSKAEIKSKVDELLRLVELDGLGSRYPSQLSGGQRQRVALARALALDPSVLLLDEPFGALDATVRKSLRKELRRIHDATGVTTIFVTHDQEEALELADRVAILNLGEIEQVGTPDEVQDNPASAFVAGFVGEASRFEGKVESGRFVAPFGHLAAEGVPDGPAQAFIRPHHFALTGKGGGLTVHDTRVLLQGPLAKVDGVTNDGQRIEAVFSREDAEKLKGDIHLTVRQAHVFPISPP